MKNLEIIKKMESQNGSAAPPWRDTKREWANNSATSRTARRKRSRPPLQTTWSWQAKQDDKAYIDELHARLEDTLKQRRGDGNYIEELQIKLDEELRQADEVQEDYVHRESQQLADAQERVRGLEDDLANADWVHEDYVHTESQRLADAQEQIQELEEDLASTVEKLHGETTQVDWLRGFLFQKASELNKRKEEQISNSRDRKNGKKSYVKKRIK